MISEYSIRFNDPAYDFSMATYEQNPSVKYNVINNPDVLFTEIAPSVLAGELPDLAKDGEWYKSFLINESGAQYYQEIIARSNDIRFDDSSLDIDALVVMPVSGLGDVDNIYSTLEKYSNQDALMANRTPIFLWVNALESQMQDEQARNRFQATTDEIERAKHDFSGLNLIDMYDFVRNDDIQRSLDRGGPWGLIMKKAYDIAALTALRLVERSDSVSKDIAIIRNDSDVVVLDDSYFEKWFTDLRQRNDRYGFQGSSVFGSTDINEARYPGLNLIMNFILRFDEYTGDRYRFQAANFAIRASAYCQIGGMGRPYFTGIGSCDAMLGERLKAVTKLRAGMQNATIEDSDIIVAITPFLKTDWSRPLAAYIDGRNPRRAWTNWSDAKNGIKQRDEDLLLVGTNAKEGFSESISRIELHVSQFLSELKEEDAIVLSESFFGKDNIVYTADSGLVFTDNGIDLYRQFYDANVGYVLTTESDKGI